MKYMTDDLRDAIEDIVIDVMSKEFYEDDYEIEITDIEPKWSVDVSVYMLNIIDPACYEEPNDPHPEKTKKAFEKEVREMLKPYRYEIAKRLAKLLHKKYMYSFMGDDYRDVENAENNINISYIVQCNRYNQKLSFDNL